MMCRMGAPKKTRASSTKAAMIDVDRRVAAGTTTKAPPSEISINKEPRKVTSTTEQTGVDRRESGAVANKAPPSEISCNNKEPAREIMSMTKQREQTGVKTLLRYPQMVTTQILIPSMVYLIFLICWCLRRWCGVPHSSFDAVMLAFSLLLLTNSVVPLICVVRGKVGKLLLDYRQKASKRDELNSDQEGERPKRKRQVRRRKQQGHALEKKALAANNNKGGGKSEGKERLTSMNKLTMAQSTTTAAPSAAGTAASLINGHFADVTRTTSAAAASCERGGTEDPSDAVVNKMARLIRETRNISKKRKGLEVKAKCLLDSSSKVPRDVKVDGDNKDDDVLTKKTGSGSGWSRGGRRKGATSSPKRARRAAASPTSVEKAEEEPRLSSSSQEIHQEATAVPIVSTFRSSPKHAGQGEGCRRLRPRDKPSVGLRADNNDDIVASVARLLRDREDFLRDTEELSKAMLTSNENAVADALDEARRREERRREKDEESLAASKAAEEQVLATCGSSKEEKGSPPAEAIKKVRWLVRERGQLLRERERLIRRVGTIRAKRDRYAEEAKSLRRELMETKRRMLAMEAESYQERAELSNGDEAVTNDTAALSSVPESTEEERQPNDRRINVPPLSCALLEGQRAGTASLER